MKNLTEFKNITKAICHSSKKDYLLIKFIDNPDSPAYKQWLISKSSNNLKVLQRELKKHLSWGNNSQIITNK